MIDIKYETFWIGGSAGISLASGTEMSTIFLAMGAPIRPSEALNPTLSEVAEKMQSRPCTASRSRSVYRATVSLRLSPGTTPPQAPRHMEYPVDANGRASQAM